MAVESRNYSSVKSAPSKEDSMSAILRSIIYLFTDTWVGPVLLVLIAIPIVGFLLRLGWDVMDDKD